MSRQFNILPGSRLPVVLVGLLAVLVAGCNSGTTASVSPPASTSTTYTAVAAAGERLTYTINKANLTYSYSITASNYGLQGSSGSGMLISNGDGTYTPQGMANVRVFPAPNGMLLGAVKLTINGTASIVPIVGFEHLQTSLSAIQGTYNGVQIACPDSTQTACGSAYGTVHFDADGTWESCNGGVVSATDPANCSGLGLVKESGTLNYLGNGLWQIMLANGVPDGTGLVFRAPNGQNVYVEDMTTPISAGGGGIGMGIGSTRTQMTSADADGTWIYAGLEGAPGYAGGLLTVSGNTYFGVTFSGSSFSDTVALNSPWTGLATSSGGGAVMLLAGTGMYAAVNTATGSFEIGLRK